MLRNPILRQARTIYRRSSTLASRSRVLCATQSGTKGTTVQPRALELAPGARWLCSQPFDFENESDETLESLCERFEELLQADESMTESDVELASGVLTVVIPDHGTYVINKQTPNRQIWLSSPVSGPARFDYAGGRWVYSRTEACLHDLLNEEIGEILKTEAGFDRCYCGGGRD